MTEVLGERLESVVWIIKRRKLQYNGHQARKQGLATVIVKGTVEGRGERGRPRRQWQDDLKPWSGWSMIELRRVAEDR